MNEIQEAVNFLGPDNLLIAHATSSYPCPLEELNLRMIITLKEMYPDIPIGYSGHEVGLIPTGVAVAFGAALHGIGDYFNRFDTEEIETALAGIAHHEQAIREALKPYNIEDYFANLTMDEFITGLF